MKWLVIYTKYLLSRILVLPSPENRGSCGGAARVLMPSLRLSRDIDFLIYRLMVSSIKLTSVVLSFIWIDAWLGANIIVDSDNFLHDRIEVSVAFGNVIILPIILLYLIYYLRIRLFIDISNEEIPIPSHPAYFSDLSRKNWLKRSAFAIICMMSLLFLSSIGSSGIATYFQIHDDTAAIIILSIAMGFAVSGIPAIVLIQALIFEKAYFYFGDFVAQLSRISKSS